MSLGTLLLAVWFILFGLAYAAVLALSAKFLGWFAVVVGAVLLLEAYHPLTVYRKPQ